MIKKDADVSEFELNLVHAKREFFGVKSQILRSFKVEKDIVKTIAKHGLAVMEALSEARLRECCSVHKSMLQYVE